MSDALEVAVRAYAVCDDEPWRFDSHEPLDEMLARPRLVLVLDTETRTDHAQSLSFASYRLCDVDWEDNVPTLSCVEEGLIHPDALADDDPDGWETLVEYVSSHAPAIDTSGATPSPILHLRSCSAFLTEVFRPAVLQARATLVCFNLPFDLSRFAMHWSKVGPRRGPEVREEEANDG